MALGTAAIAAAAWRDYGQVIVCDTYQEMARQADEIASEHVQVMTRDPQYSLEHMRNLAQAPLRVDCSSSEMPCPLPGWWSSAATALMWPVSSSVARRTLCGVG